MAIEMYFRNPEGLIYRLLGLQFFTYCLLFLGEYFIQVLPEDSPLFVVRLVAAFLNMTTSLYFFQTFAKSSLHIRSVFYHSIALLPLVGIFFLLLDTSWFKITIHSGPIWRSVEMGLGLGLLTFLLCCYTIVTVFIYLGLMYRRLKSKQWILLEKKRIKIFFIAAVLVSALSAFPYIFLKPLEQSNPYINVDIIAMYSTFIYVFSLRYAMAKYDFLAAIGGRYEILFNQSQEGIVMMDDKWRYVDANPAFLRLLGIQDINDKSWRNAKYSDCIISLEGNRRTKGQIMKAMQERAPILFETRLINRLQQAYDIEVQINFFEMEARIWSFVLVKDISIKKENEQKLIKMAYHDSLTGLANRRKFLKDLNNEFQRIEGKDEIFAVLLIDLDQFKWINDTLGHSAGDELLCSIAGRLLSIVQKKGHVARIGGDEFVVLMPRLNSATEAEWLAGEIIEKVRVPVTINNRQFQITASVGISFAPRDGTDTETIMSNADTAMYSAKKLGKNQYQLFSSAQRKRAKQGFILVNGLRNALLNNEFMLHYQPQFELSSGRLVGVEALLRWNSTELGPVSPNDFIPIAEESGAIVPIGEWVLQTAIRQGKSWIESDQPDLIVSVNVSARQLKEPQFVKQLARMLKEEDFPAKNLCLEITESSAMDNVEQSLQVCREIVDIGVTLTLDDFGSGYSSLGMLSTFPFRTVKIDKSLIDKIETNRKSADIVRTIVRLSRYLRMEVLGEGVEKEEQHERLRRFGCRFVQGFLYSRPIPAAEIEVLIEKEKLKLKSPFRVFEEIEVNGLFMLPMIDVVGAKVIPILEKTGLDVHYSDQWYPVPEWLTTFYNIGDHLGADVLHDIGKITTENGLWPSEIKTIETALESINNAYKMNHRSRNSENLNKLGDYAFFKTGNNMAKIVCDNPYPCDYDKGIIEALANKFKEPNAMITVVHDDSSCRKNNGTSCTYHIKW